MARSGSLNKLVINGSNEKEYDLLVKGGEDLRLDQRVQQIFKIINKCFDKDLNCHKRELKLSTFQVVPISNRTGVLEWINHTVTLKDIIEKGLIERKSISKCRAAMTVRKWLHALNPKGNIIMTTRIASIQDQHIIALN